MTPAARRGLAALLAAAARDLEDAALLSGPSPANAGLLLARAVQRLLAGLLLSEDGGKPAASFDALARVDADNPVRDALAALRDAAERDDRPLPDTQGRLNPPPGAAWLRLRLGQARAVLDTMLAGFEIDPAAAIPEVRRPDRLRPEPEPDPEPGPEPEPEPEPDAPPAEPRPVRLAARRPARGAAAAPTPAGRVLEPAGAAGQASSVTFWRFADSWRLDDLEALAVLGHEGGLTAKGTRPRFRLSPAEASRFALLRELDSTLTAAGRTPADWLRQKVDGVPRLTRMAEGGEAAARAVLHQATAESLRSSVG